MHQTHQQQAVRAGASSDNDCCNIQGPGILEIREYTLNPASVTAYLKLASETAELRAQLLPFLGMFTCDVGGDLNTVTHFYYYKDLEEREAIRAASKKNAQWLQFIAASKPMVVQQRNRILTEAAAIYTALGQHASAAGFTSPQQSTPHTPVYELRQYQLQPGCHPVSRVVGAVAESLPHRIAADKEGQLVAFASSEFGVLNTVVELWRYPSAAACLRARQAIHQVPACRDSLDVIAPCVQQCQASLLHPTSFSHWQ